MPNYQDSEFQTTQKVKITYEYANPVLRMFAYVFDLIIKSLISLVFFIIFLIIITGGTSLASVFQDSDINKTVIIIVSVLSIIISLFMNFYNIFFEIMWKGQTPGKRFFKIKVVNDDGSYASITAIFLRNIFRIVDFLPVSNLIGVITMFVNKKHKRVGDIIASTIVIREEVIPLPDSPEELTLPCFENIDNIYENFSQKTFDSIKNYINSRKTLAPLAKYNVEEKLIEYITSKLDIRVPQMVSKSDFIDALYYKLKNHFN